MKSLAFLVFIFALPDLPFIPQKLPLCPNFDFSQIIKRQSAKVNKSPKLTDKKLSNFRYATVRVYL